MTKQLFEKFVIMAGVPKCGSTSVFEYLNDHPQIAGALRKEPNFFWSPAAVPGIPEYKLMWESGYHNKPLEHYLDAFPVPANDEAFRLDGSIGYWTTPESAQLIQQHLPNTKLIFIFRDPVERFVSWFKYRTQHHAFPPGTTMDDVLEGPLRHDFHTELALETGRYSTRLKAYWDLFDHDEILLLRFADLRHNPSGMLQRICGFLEIDSRFYEHYEFTRHNASLAARNTAIDRMQYKAVMAVRDRLLAYPRVFGFASAVNQRAWLPLYQFLNSSRADKPVIQEDSLSFLHNYYKDEAELLRELTGVDGLLGD